MGPAKGPAKRAEHIKGVNLLDMKKTPVSINGSEGTTDNRNPEFCMSKDMEIGAAKNLIKIN